MCRKYCVVLSAHTRTRYTKCQVLLIDPAVSQPVESSAAAVNKPALNIHDSSPSAVSPTNRVVAIWVTRNAPTCTDDYDRRPVWRQCVHTLWRMTVCQVSQPLEVLVITWPRQQYHSSSSSVKSINLMSSCLLSTYTTVHH